MPYKDPEKQKLFRQEWYKKNQKAIQEKSNANRRKHRVIMREYGHALKTELGCVVCGENDKVLLDFHHLDPGIKEHNISAILNGSKGSRRLVKVNEELAKCVVICKRHHALHHDGRQKLFKKYVNPHQKKMRDLMEYLYDQVSGT